MESSLLRKNKRFRPVLSILEENEEILFISTFIRKTNNATTAYWSFFMAFVVLFIANLFLGHAAGYPGRIWVVAILGGIIGGTLLTTVLHQLIQAFQYKLFGAKDIHLNFSWKRMSFFVSSNQYAVSDKQFSKMVYCPFLILSIACVIAAFTLKSYWSLFFLTTLLIHSFYCMRDFSLLSYLKKYPGSYLYHEAGSKKTFVFVPEKD